MKKNEWSTRFSELNENRVDHTFWLHLRKNKQKMKTGWTTLSWNKAIWLALSLCHMNMTCKINKLDKPGGLQGYFHTLFGRSAAIYGHFRADALMSEWSIRISHQLSFLDYKIVVVKNLIQYHQDRKRAVPILRPSNRKNQPESIDIHGRHLPGYQTMWKWWAYCAMECIENRTFVICLAYNIPLCLIK